MKELSFGILAGPWEAVEAPTAAQLSTEHQWGTTKDGPGLYPNRRGALSCALLLLLYEDRRFPSPLPVSPGL